VKSPAKLLLFALILAGACKEDNYQWNIYLENKSNQDVHVKLTSSRDSTSKSIYIKPNEEVYIQTGSDMGKGISYYALQTTENYLQYDTCYVIFNDTVALLYSAYENSDRNILFTRNYTRSDGNGPKKYTNYDYRYRITEQDFLDAEPF